MNLWRTWLAFPEVKEALGAGVRDIDRFLQHWEMDVRGLRRRLIVAPTPRERWYALWLLAQGWTAAATAEVLERDPHTIGRLRQGRAWGLDVRAVRGESLREYLRTPGLGLW